MNRINTILFKKIPAHGLAVFRITYCLNLVFELVHIFKYRHLYFDKIPYLDVHFPDTKLVLLLWMIVVIFITIGLYTRIATLINYVLTLVLVASMTAFEYHMFYVYTGMNFLLILLPIHRTIAVDALRLKLKYLSQGMLYVPDKVAKITYFLPVFLAIGLVYFDSSIAYKMKSPMWLEGLGLWLPSSLPHVSIDDTQWLLDQEVLVRGLSYLTMVFEFMFIFLFWNKKYRVPLLIIGLVLHLGIHIQFPIPYFSFGYIAIYTLMVPVSCWDRIGFFMATTKKVFTLYYDEKKIAARRFVTLVQVFDVRNRIEIIAMDRISETSKQLVQHNTENVVGVDPEHNVYIGKVLLDGIHKAAPLFFPVLLLQKFSVFSFLGMRFLPEPEQAKKGQFLTVSHEKKAQLNSVKNGLLLGWMVLSVVFQIQVHKDFLGTGKAYANTVNQFLIKNFGITVHPVFMDSHFQGYTTIYGLKYKGDFLPILDERGMPGDYLSGGIYINWLFRVNAPYIKEKAYSLRKGFINYSSFWAYQNDINISENQEFEIVRKKIKVSFKWEKELLRNNIAAPWQHVGTLSWKDRRAQLTWKD